MRLYLLFVTVIFLFSCTNNSEKIMVAEFESGDVSGWEEKEFKENTKYKIAYVDARKTLVAKSSASASAMIREIEIDLEEYPYINWTWRSENVLQGQDERSKGGDDYPARVYVLFSDGSFFWKRVMSINYVWSSNQPIGSSWPNAYTSNAVMLAVESGRQNLGKWLYNKRNVREDLRKLFGKDIRYIDAVAIMTDTDNAGGRAETYYGDIYFTQQ